MSNQAAWIKEKNANPLVVDEAPMWKPEADEVLIKNKAIAINPVDWMVQDFGVLYTKYPNIIGEDVAGEIVEVGDKVKHLHKGQRVIGFVPLQRVHSAVI